MKTPIIVLGIDGLDAEKVDEWEPSLRLDMSNEMSLDDFEEPYYTDEIWPTMILGESPRNQGWNPDEGREETESAAWENPLLNALSTAAERTVPHSLRRKIGQTLINRGHNPDSSERARYRWSDDNLFSKLKSRVIEVPNWNRGEMGLDLSRESWEYVVNADDGVERFYEAADDEIDEVTESIESAAEHPYDIIFTHYHYLDLVQHYFDEEVQRDWYARTVDLVDHFVDEYPDHTIVVLSDHGLVDYAHRPPAFVSVHNPWTEELPESPHEVRAWLEGRLLDESSLNEKRQEHLEDLGYL